VVLQTYFSYFIPYKRIYIYPKVSFEMYVLKCVKIWVKL
jgi:hypothetical protein